MRGGIYAVVLCEMGWNYFDVDLFCDSHTHSHDKPNVALLVRNTVGKHFSLRTSSKFWMTYVDM